MEASTAPEIPLQNVFRSLRSPSPSSAATINASSSLTHQMNLRTTRVRKRVTVHNRTEHVEKKRRVLRGDTMSCRLRSMVGAMAAPPQDCNPEEDCCSEGDSERDDHSYLPPEPFEWVMEKSGVKTRSSRQTVLPIKADILSVTDSSSEEDSETDDQSYFPSPRGVCSNLNMADLETQDEITCAIFKSALRKYRHYLKKTYFTGNETHQVPLLSLKRNLRDDDWECLVLHWFRPKNQDKCLKQKNNYCQDPIKTPMAQQNAYRILKKSTQYPIMQW